LIRYLIFRPVAVLLSFVLCTVLGFYYFSKVPISLLPDIDVPRIVITITYPDHTAAQIEDLVTRPVREQMVTVQNIKDIDSKSANHSAWIYMQYEHGTRMDLAYVEVNEKLDHIISALPTDVPRPVVTRINTSDVPVMRLHVLPKNNTPDIAELSILTERVIKKRIEQVVGVSLVDINGQVEEEITIVPDMTALHTYGLSPDDIITAVDAKNQELGSLSIRDGQYRYFVRVANSIADIESIKNIAVPVSQNYIPLHRLAKVNRTAAQSLSYHIYDTTQGLVLTIQKQADARMTDLMSRLNTAIHTIKKDYPQLDFAVSRNQSFLLDAGIDNLKQDIVYGGALTILLLFLFLGHWSAPTLMSISIPLSLVISIVFFYLFDISFNIISLSGIALGIGMLIDNSIVVIDHISRKRKTGLSLIESAVQGTEEMTAPVISQVLTTVAVYAPLVLLHGMAGDLIKDQAKALTISLLVSLLVAFVLAPLLYKYLISWISKGQIKEDTIFYRWIERGYHRMIDHILRYRLVYFLFTIALMPVGFWIATRLPVRALPEIEKTESLVKIDWNEEIDAQQNKKRTEEIILLIKSTVLSSESDIGIKQYVLQEEKSNIQSCDLYYICKSETEKNEVDRSVHHWMLNHYPKAIVKIEAAANAFTQLFSNDKPYFEARFLDINENVNPALQEYLSKNPDAKPGDSQSDEIYLEIIPDYTKMTLYGITRSQVDNTLARIIGVLHVTDIKKAGAVTRVILKDTEKSIAALDHARIINTQGISYNLKEFIQLRYQAQPKYLLADRSGKYKNILWNRSSANTITSIENDMAEIARNTNSPVHFQGQYFDDKAQLRQLLFIFIIVTLLMYFILAIQYESIWQPFLVMLTIPLGITGAMIVLWLTGSALDTMAAIGFIVILGLIVDDPILKIETLNRLRKQYHIQGKIVDEALLKQMIHEAGSICLKPLLMVSLTTTLALVPILFIPGIGNELQKPMVWVIIGGLSIGTFFTTWFVPLAYWYSIKWGRKNK
jgi:multidrug efflux pump subunit AcrB